MTTRTNNNRTIEQIASMLAGMNRTPCPSCDDGYIFSGEGATSICPSGRIHVRMREASAFFPVLSA